MKFSHLVSSAIISMATFAIVQPQIVFAQTRPEIDIVKSITVKIDGREYGTGVIVAHQGNTYTVLTNWHVVGNKGKQEVTTFDNQSYEINPNSIKQLQDFDLAIFEFISSNKYHVAKIDESKLNELDKLYIAGYPTPRPGIEGERIFQFTEGIISGIKKNVQDGYTLVYTNETRPGMSGGPILNQRGQLVGIHGLSEGETKIDSQTGETEIIPRPDHAYKLGIPISIFVDNAPSLGINLSSLNNSSPPTRPPVIIPERGSDTVCSGTVCK